MTKLNVEGEYRPILRVFKVGIYDDGVFDREVVVIAPDDEKARAEAIYHYWHAIRQQDPPGWFPDYCTITWVADIDYIWEGEQAPA
jgi:hypothetical protein